MSRRLKPKCIHRRKHIIDTHANIHTCTPPHKQYTHTHVCMHYNMRTHTERHAHTQRHVHTCTHTHTHTLRSLTFH